MNDGRVDITAACPSGHASAQWRGTQQEPGGGTGYVVNCLPCGDRPWTAAAQAARARPKPEPEPVPSSLRPVLNTASDAARAWYSRLTRRNA